jgi:hypothetical protein
MIDRSWNWTGLFEGLLTLRLQLFEHNTQWQIRVWILVHTGNRKLVENNEISS